MKPLFESSVVRIYGKLGKVKGAGFLVGKNQVLTCAHVIAYALGIKANTLEMPAEEISLDFPIIAPGKMLKAKVIFWRPVNPGEKYEDIAGLELTELPPNSARPVRLVKSDDLLGHKFECFGFPSGKPYGVYAFGELKKKIANGWVQIEAITEPGFPVQEGFSGAPVWDEELKGVAGMAVAAEKKLLAAKVAFMIPVDLLIEAWDVLKEIWNKRLIAACPYRGLFAFQEKDADLFFGREDLTTELVKAVESHKIVPLIGPSGSGKSSVVFAGLFPQLRDPVPPGQLNIYSSGRPR